MGCMRFGVPEELAGILIDQFAPPYFVETGTYKGDMHLGLPVSLSM